MQLARSSTQGLMPSSNLVFFRIRRLRTSLCWPLWKVCRFHPLSWSNCLILRIQRSVGLEASSLYTCVCAASMHNVKCKARMVNKATTGATAPPWNHHYLLLCLLLMLDVRTLAEARASTIVPSRTGHELCPCLQSLEEVPIVDDDFPGGVSALINQESLGDNFNASTYGLGCAAHDVNIPACNPADCEASANVFPPRTDCDLSWCRRSFCWVDPNNCQLLHRRSRYFPRSNRFYSYATCGEADSFTNTNRFAALAGKVLRVGMNSNTYVQKKERQSILGFF